MQIKINIPDKVYHRLRSFLGHGYCLRDEDVKIIGEAIYNGQTNQPKPQWIPVTKKAHPDLPIRVQVQLDNGWIITAYYQDGEWLTVPDCGAPLQDNWMKHGVNYQIPTQKGEMNE